MAQKTHDGRHLVFSFSPFARSPPYRRFHYRIPCPSCGKDLERFPDLDTFKSGTLGACCFIGKACRAVAYIPLTVLAVPASILTIGGGYLFGLTVGFIADSIGSTAGATAAFLIGKTVGRSYVVSKLKDYPQFQAIAIAIQRSGFKIVLLLRLVPLLPFNMLNYLLSVTPVRLGEYILASWMGMMPMTFGFVYVGTTIKDLSDVTHGWHEVSTTRWILIAFGFSASVALMIVITRVARKTLKKALEENDGVNDILVASDSSALKNRCKEHQHPLIIKIDPTRI